MTVDRKQLEGAAVDHAHLRGLIGVPLGGLMILAALGNEEWGPFRHLWVFPACAAAILLLSLGITRYYDRHYGRITAARRQQVRTAAATACTALLVFGGSFLLRSDASWSLDLPVNGLAAALAAGFLTYAALTAGIKRHHGVIWGAVLVGALMPIWGGLDLSATSNVGLALGGAAAMAAGVCDHVMFVRRFGRPDSAA